MSATSFQMRRREAMAKKQAEKNEPVEKTPVETESVETPTEEVKTENEPAVKKATKKSVK